MKTVLLKIKKNAEEKTNDFITLLLALASIGFYLGFILGRHAANLF